MWCGRSSPGSRSGFSPRTRRSSSTSRLRMSAKVGTGTTKCSRPSRTCAACWLIAESRSKPEVGRPRRWGGATPKDSLVCVDLYQPIKEVTPFQQRVDPHVFVQAVDVAEIRSGEYGHDAVGGYSNRIRELTVGGSCLKQRQYGQSRPELRCQLLEGAEDPGRERWRGR